MEIGRDKPSIDLHLKADKSVIYSIALGGWLNRHLVSISKCVRPMLNHKSKKNILSVIFASWPIKCCQSPIDPDLFSYNNAMLMLVDQRPLNRFST